MQAQVTTRGRVTIPVEIRRKLGIEAGTHIVIGIDEGERCIVLTPITREYIHGLRGKYKGKGLMKALMKDRASERS